MEAIRRYEQDYDDPSTRYQSLGYPAPDGMRAVVQTNPDSAHRHLIVEAQKASPEDPLYVLIWGNMVVIKETLFAEPSITDNLRMLTIATHVKGPPEGDCEEKNYRHYSVRYLDRCSTGRNQIATLSLEQDLYWCGFLPPHLWRMFADRLLRSFFSGRYFLGVRGSNIFCG